MDVAAWSAISAVLGGVLLKVVEGYFTSRVSRGDDLARYRGELQTAIKEREEEIRALRKEIDEMQSRYYELKEQYARLEARCEYLSERNTELTRIIEGK